MDFLEVLKEKLESLSFTPRIIAIGKYNQNENSMSIVPSPANIDEKYMDKGKIYPFAFDLHVHNKNNLLGYQSSQELMKLLTNANAQTFESKTGSYTLVTLGSLVTPSYVDETQYGVLWTASYEAELYIRGDE